MSENKNSSDKIRTPIQDMVASTQENSTTGPLIGSIVIIVLIIIGGLYYLGNIILIKKNQIKDNEIFEEQTNKKEIEETVKQSSTDDIPSIEQDIISTDIDSVDSELKEI